ncbi:MAG: hypothetical protein WAU57_02455 [Xanthobacteraceae bacterium]
MTTLLMRIMLPALAGLMILGGAHRAFGEPLHMVCEGKNYFQTGPQQARTIEDTVSVTIEWDNAHSTPFMQTGKAWVGNEEGILMVKPNENDVTIIGDVQAKSGLRIGSLDRVTGHLYLDFGMFQGLPKTFIGTCKPGKKLF